MIEVGKVGDLAILEVDEKVTFEGEEYHVNEIHKTNVHTMVILEDANGRYKEVIISK